MICPDCCGSGTLLEWGRREVTCNRCQGSGSVYVPVPTAEPERLFTPAPNQIPGQLALDG